MQDIVQIFGYMRSGTSMCRRLLHRHPDFYITSEIGRSVYPMLLGFLQSSNQAFRKMPTSAIRGRWGRKKADLLREMWLGLSKFDENPESARQVQFLGNKTPRAELQWKRFDAVLKPLEPKYVYCLRDPRKVLRSKLNMHLSSRDFDFSFNDLERSVTTLLEMRDACPSRLFVFAVDEYGRRPHETTGDLLDFLGARRTDDIVRHMIDQPVANSMSHQIRSRVVSGESVSGVVELTDAQIHRIDQSEVFGRVREILSSIEARPWKREHDG